MNFSLKNIFCTLLAGAFMFSAVPVQSSDFPWKNSLIGLAALATAGLTYHQLTKPKGFDREYWDWKNIKTDASHLAQKLQKTNQGAEFLLGVATAAHQVEGNCENSWTQFERERGLEQSGRACDHWKKIDEDIQLLKKLGVNSYRFSVEWSKIQPGSQLWIYKKDKSRTKEYTFNEDALAHYERVCDKLRAAGIKPIITLHHYTNPLWFEDLGGFEKAENIKYFVGFCEKVFDRLKDKAHMWITFNSPSGYALNAYYRGVYAPGKSEADKTGSMQLAMEVTKNMLEAHVRVYQSLKATQADAQIGILHHHYPLKPSRSWHPMDNISAYFGNQMNNYSTLEFFRTGNFNVRIPSKVSLKHYNAHAPRSLDFLGLSFYSHGHIEGKQPKHRPEDKEKLQHIRTDKESFVIYPEGMYHSIKEVASYIGEIPIYITENGTADDERAESKLTVDGQKMTRREFFLRRYLAAIAQAKEDGFDVRGYIHWSLMDNFEWNEGYTKKFGLYDVDRTKADLPRTMREGAKYYQSLVHSARELPSGAAQPVVHRWE